MEDPVATSRLLDGQFNEVYRYLLWFLAAPVAWFILSVIYRRMNNIEEPTWVEKLLGAGDEESPGFLGFLNLDNGPALAPGALAVADPPPPKPPVKPERVFELFKRYEKPWAIAGGWAIDLYLGRETREHHDIEIAVLRRDFADLWEYLVGWQPHYINPAHPEEPVPWKDGIALGAPIHELHTVPPAADVRTMEILLNDADGDDWVYRRDPRIRLPLDRAILRSPEGIPFLAPEIVLLYKSKALREVDRADFVVAQGNLEPAAREWLRQSLELTIPGHGWLTGL